MIRLRSIAVVAVMLAAIWLAQSSPAASPTPQFTAIRVTDMHCSACAKKIAAKLYLVSGVAEVRANVEKDTAYVKAQEQKAPSPKALWEAVEAAGFEPVELNGPAGSFTSKPNS